MAKEINDLSRVEAKLDVLVRLVALSAAPDGLLLTDRAVRLQRAGIPPKDIAALLGTSSATVRTVLHGAKRKGKGKGRRAKNG
jgi:hypothetical protein